MRFVATALPGVYVVELEAYTDDRGFFARAWCTDELQREGLESRLAQSSLSRNTKAGTLRGMHFQEAPHAEVKFVRCVRGALFDVVLDLRRDSQTYLDWIGVHLDADTGNAVYIPEGCAHGFQTLVDETDALYMISVPYEPTAARGVRWDDPAFGIVWPEADRVISERDREWPDYDRSSGGEPTGISSS